MYANNYIPNVITSNNNNNTFNPYMQQQYQQQIFQPQQQQQYQQYQQQQQQYQQQQQPNFPSIKPVTGIEEVRASSISFDGSVSYFSDKANNKIYTKFIDLNGLPQIQIYKLEQNPISENNNNNIDNKEFVSRKEFDILQEKIGKYEIMFNELMGMGGNKNE